MVIDINAENIFNKLSEEAARLGCRVQKDAPLSSVTSFKIGSECAVLIEPEKVSQIRPLLAFIKENNIPYIILGNGTNVLAPDERLEKAVIKIGDLMADIRLIDESTVYCSAGTKLVSLCKFALEHSLSGLEFAFGIPGTLGGAIFMNAGAYGGEIKDVLHEISHITDNLKEETVPAESAHLSYRYSDYKKNGCIITGAVLRLRKADKEEIKAAMDDFLFRRKDKQPLEYPSAGSTFKRPATGYAGALIEQCNLKGKSIGGAQVSEKHAGFVINKGGATANDVTELIDLIKKTVETQTGVSLEPEVIILR